MPESNPAIITLRKKDGQNLELSHTELRAKVDTLRKRAIEECFGPPLSEEKSQTLWIAVTEKLDSLPLEKGYIGEEHIQQASYVLRPENGNLHFWEAYIHRGYTSRGKDSKPLLRSEVRLRMHHPGQEAFTNRYTGMRFTDVSAIWLEHDDPDQPNNIRRTQPCKNMSNRFKAQETLVRLVDEELGIEHGAILNQEKDLATRRVVAFDYALPQIGDSANLMFRFPSFRDEDELIERETQEPYIGPTMPLRVSDSGSVDLIIKALSKGEMDLDRSVIQRIAENVNKRIKVEGIDVEPYLRDVPREEVPYVLLEK